MASSQRNSNQSCTTTHEFIAVLHRLLWWPGDGFLEGVDSGERELSQDCGRGGSAMKDTKRDRSLLYFARQPAVCNQEARATERRFEGLATLFKILSNRTQYKIDIVSEPSIPIRHCCTSCPSNRSMSMLGRRQGPCCHRHEGAPSADVHIFHLASTHQEWYDFDRYNPTR